MSNITQLTTTVVHTHNGTPATNSLVIADRFKKRHTHVLRAISQLECSPEFTETNFGLSEYTDESGKKNKYFIITRDGFMFLAMGFTGKEAAQWKERFITAFNELERMQQPQLPLIPTLDGTRWRLQFNDGRANMEQIPDGAIIQTRDQILENIQRTGGLDAMFSVDYVNRLIDACAKRLNNEIQQEKEAAGNLRKCLKTANERAKALA